MSVTHESPIAFGISLAVNSSPEKVNEAVDAIYRFFNMSAATGVAPAAVAAVQNTTVVNNGAPAIPAAAGVELDKNGLPWNEEIHSSSRKQNADGTWRMKKGVSDAKVAEVTAILRQNAAAPATPVAALPTAPALPTVTQPGPVLPALPVAAAPSEYDQFLTFLTTHTISPQNPNGKLPAEFAAQVIEAYGIAGGIAGLAQRPDMVGAVRDYIAQQLGL